MPISNTLTGIPRPPARPPTLTRRTVLTLGATAALSARFGRVAAQEATPTTKSGTVRVNGIDLYFEETGSGPPLLNIPP